MATRAQWVGSGAKTDRAHPGPVLTRGAWGTLCLALLVAAGINAYFAFRLAAGRISPFAFVRDVYAFNTTAFPLLLALAGGIGLLGWALERRAGGLLAAGLLGLAGALTLVGVRGYATHWEPERLVVHEAVIETGKVTKPVRILHLSDIQSEAVGAHEQRVFARVRDLQPNLVLHTGDLLAPIEPATVDSERPKLAALFASLDPPLGCLNAPGDTDWYLRQDPELDFGGLRTLAGEDLRLATGGGQLALLGLTLAQSRHGAAERVRDWVRATPDTAFRIVLGHSPEFVLDCADQPVDLCLAGHTHGGQVRLPFVGPLVTASRVPRSWARGCREVGRTRLNVSAGIGCEHAEDLPDLRINCPPEMTLITLSPARACPYSARHAG